MADYELVAGTVLQFPMSVSCQKNLAYSVCAGVETPPPQALDADKRAPVEWPVCAELHIYAQNIYIIYKDVYSSEKPKKGSQVYF